MRKLILIVILLILSANTVFAQDVTPTPGKCQVTIDDNTGRNVITGSCSAENLIELMKSLSSNLGISSGDINVSIPLPVLVVEGAGGAKETFYPKANDQLIQVVHSIKPLDPDLWLKPFNESENGYAASNGYFFDSGKLQKCDESDKGCQVTIAGQSYYARTGDSQVPRLGYQCSMTENDGKNYGCTLIIVNLAPQEATFVVGAPKGYTWTGTYFNGGNIVDDSNPPVEVKPAQPALAIAFGAMGSHLTHEMITNAGNCASSSACDGNDVTIIFTSGPTILAKWEGTYEKPVKA